MTKMQKLMPLWGPYSKKYSGISRITDHTSEKGVRFDLVVSPAVANTNTCPPNVTIPVGVHPWTAKADYTHYAYRCDLEWKDKIYADVSFTKLTEESVLVRTALVNHSELPQNCLVNYFSALEFPSKYTTTVSLPKKCIYKKALDYVTYDYHTRRPWDEQVMDGLHKGEFFDDAFSDHRGLGDRDNNRYILQKFPTFGEEAGDSVSYVFNGLSAFEKPVLTVRYQTTGEQDSIFMMNGNTVVFPVTPNGLQTVQLPLPYSAQDTLNLSFVSLGTGGVELDFLAVTEQTDAAEIVCKTGKHHFVPQIQTALFSDGAKAVYRYDGVEKPFVLRTFNASTRFRNFPTGALEDSPTSRITQPDESFGDMLEQFSAAFSEKHSDDGFYHNTVVHTIFIEPGEAKTEYAVISYGEAEYQTVSQYETVYQNAVQGLEKLAYTKAGEKYAFSNQLLRAAMFQNTVYPLYLHGEYVVHHTPGKRWDSFYTWDSGFIGLDMALYAPKLAEGILDMYFSTEDNPDYAFLLHGSPVPVHIYHYFEMLNHNNDKTELYGYYDRAKLFYDFLAGKINGSTTAKFKSGLTTTFDYFYNCSGMDDLPPQKAMYQEHLQRVCAPAISSSQVIRTAKMLKTIAEHLGKEADAVIFQADIDRLTEALQKCSWDEQCGYFSYVVHDRDGNPQTQLRTSDGENLNKTMDGIYPLLAGAVTEAQKERILGHLKSDTELFTPVGISAVDRTAGYYLPNGYWNGNVWLSHQWFVWKTMLDLGETDFAYKIAETALNAWKREVEYSYYTFEMFSIETGRGGWFHNFGGLSAPINLWSAAYFTPGTYQSGFDTFCENAVFNDIFTAFCGHFTNSCVYDSALLVVLAENGKYRVTLNGAPADFTARFDGMLEIKLPKGCKNAEVRVQLV
ncbi:MAG: MGH1-like glycoside hydrolase domain-containing protein [Candidatus Fimenecus sp.]